MKKTNEGMKEWENRTDGRVVNEHKFLSRCNIHAGLLQGGGVL